MFYIGISGWTYKGWRGVFYPEKLPQKRELEHASREFNSIEINGTHYSLQKPDTFKSWAEQTPKHFIFSIKGSRYITHLKRLKDIETPLANFFASGVLALGEKLGPFLWQLPPSLKFDGERIGRFLKLLPHNTRAAARLAKKHDDRMANRTWTKPGGNRPLRHCVEVRHPSFMVPEFFDLLRKYGAAFVFADTAGKWPYAEDLVADFVYVRLHGDKQLYVSGYTERALRRWASRLRKWAKTSWPRDAKLIAAKRPKTPQIKDVFVYFDNDVKVRAPADAKRLREILGEKKPYNGAVFHYRKGL